ncbi:MAG: PfkB family carbohydrate kinase [Acidimicrobiales bacterium]
MKPGSDASDTVVVLGENLVDLVVDDEGMTPTPGGGPFTVARTIARLGLSPHFFSGVANDRFGVQLRDALLDDGVIIAFGRPPTKPTTLAVADSRGGSATYTFYLTDTAAFEVDTATALERYGTLPTPAALYVGTLGLVVEPMASTAIALVEAAGPTTLVVIDPNCRPSATADPNRYRSRLDELFVRADVVKVSTDDLEFIDPDHNHLDTARSIAERGVPWIIVTDGPRPIRLLGPSGMSQFPVEDRPIVDTIGAGDALVGGFLSWWVGHHLDRRALGDHDAVSDALTAAITIAAITCERHGALPPTRSDLVDTPSWEWLTAPRRSDSLT